MSHTTRIKICGVKEPETAAEAVRLGADFIGLMMYPGSKRFIDLQRAIEISKVVKQAGGEPVAVFVDANSKKMLDICQQADINTVQLHGSAARQSHPDLPESIRRIYVLPVSPEGILQGDVDQGVDALNKTRDLLLFDSLQGGSAQSFDWEKLRNPYDFSYLLAGGLSSINIKTALQTLHPFGVDVSSGVENASGNKDIQLIRQFIDSVKEVSDE